MNYRHIFHLTRTLAVDENIPCKVYYKQQLQSEVTKVRLALEAEDIFLRFF